MIPIGLRDIQAAADRIQPHIRRTPVERFDELDREYGAELFLKLENLQEAGAFKSRGACNVVFSLAEDEAARGVITHSSGNHAAALARAAKLRGVPAYVVMPSDAPAAKVANVKSFGATITFCEPTLAARESTAGDLQAQTGATFVHPYDDWRIIAGAGTAALEFAEEVADLELVVTPVGGGGLLSGTAIVAHELLGPYRVWAAEPVAADDAWQSFRAGEWVPQLAPTTQADGLRTSLGKCTFAVLQRLVGDVILAGDTRAQFWARRLSTLLDAPVEVSSAVPLAALEAHRNALRGKRIGIIISGGNVAAI